jgi:hypothetical protein
VVIKIQEQTSVGWFFLFKRTSSLGFHTQTQHLVASLGASLNELRSLKILNPAIEVSNSRIFKSPVCYPFIHDTLLKIVDDLSMK